MQNCHIYANPCCNDFARWDLTPHLGHYIIHLISVGMKLVAKIHQGEHDDIYLLVVLACIQLFQAAVKVSVLPFNSRVYC